MPKYILGLAFFATLLAGSAAAQHAGGGLSASGPSVLPANGTGVLPSSTNRYLTFNAPGTNVDSAPQSKIIFNLPLNYHSALIDKYVSGSTISTISDGSFNTLTTQHSNNMRRELVSQWWHSNGSGLRATTYIGNDGTGGARGSSNGIVARAYLYDQADYGTANTGTEAQGLSGYTMALKDRNNAYAMLWGVDSTVIGPTTGQEGGIFGMPVVIAKRNSANTISISADGNSDLRGAYGLTVQSIPGIASQPPSGDDNAGTATYPVDAAIAVTGFTGDYDGPNIATDGFDATARSMADYAVKIGGLSMGPWYETRGSRFRPNSKINNGIDISQHYGIAIHIHDRHPLNTGTAIKVTSTGGTVEIATNTGIGVAPSASYKLDVLSDIRLQGPTAAQQFIDVTSGAVGEKSWMVGADNSSKSLVVQTRADDHTFAQNVWVATRSGTGVTAQSWLVGGTTKLALSSSTITVTGTLAVSGNSSFGLLSGGTHNGNIRTVANDQFPSFAFYSGATTKMQVVGDVSAQNVFMDVPGILRVRDTLNGGNTRLQLDMTTGNFSLPALNAAGVIAGSWCSTAAGLFVYKVGANCF